MRLALCRICERADRLATSGNPVLFGLFNQMGAPVFPARLDPSCLAIEIETTPHEHSRQYPIEVRLIDEDGRTLSEWRAIYEVGPAQLARTIRSFLVVPIPWDDRFIFPAPGSYRFDVVHSPDEGVEEILGGEVLTVLAMEAGPIR